MSCVCMFIIHARRGDVKAGETWTDKLMDKGKAKNEEASVGGTGSAGADGEGADDDEWDD